MKRNVAILLFDEVEVLDFAGPFEVFAVTDELRGHDTFNVFTVAEATTAVRARHGLKVVADYALKNLPVGTGCPASTQSTARRRSAPVIGIPLPGRLASNCPR